MKHGMFQRSVSLLLALVMILGNVPMNALAAEGEETTAPACEHSYDAVTTDATCSQDGSVVYTCACGDTYTETIPATGEHAWGDWTVTAEATYEAAGLETRACGCGATEEREIPQLVAAHEHAWGDWTVAAEATYEAAGLETRTCECGETENREIPQLVKVKAELSGDTRELYFLNTEAWEEVYVFWSFEEEDFENVAFPGAAMEADEDLENVFVVELPVEADAVTFNDGVEVTEELKAYERENGIEVIHFFAAELDAELDYFSAAEQAEDENNAAEWLSYADLHEAWEEAKKAEEEAARKAAEAEQIAEVQAMIDALPTTFATQEEVDAFWTSTEALDAAIEALTEAQQEKLDQSNYDAAIDAAAAFYNPEFEDAATWEDELRAVDYVPGNSYEFKGGNTKPTVEVEGGHWADAPESVSESMTCDKDYEHTHTDSCYTTPNLIACQHHYESSLLGHPESCFEKAEECKDAKCHLYGLNPTVYHFSEGKFLSKKYYHAKSVCDHEHSLECYTLGCEYALKGEHTHGEKCYTYTWELLKNQYDIIVLDENNTEVFNGTLEYGDTIPVGEAVDDSYETNTEIHTFKEWRDSDGKVYNTLPTAEKATTYTAIFTVETRYYTINWVNGDETTTTSVAYGVIPDAPTATKSDKVDADGNVMATYINGTWGEIAEVTGEATYTATFTEVPKEYTIIFKSHDGEEKVSVKYGEVPAYNTPADYEDGNKFYTFQGWNPDVVTVTGAATYEAVYTDAKIYKVTFDANGGTLNKENIQRVIDGKKAPELEATREGYRFDGWLLNGEAYDFETPVTADITLTAKWVKLVAVSFDVEGIPAQTLDINGFATKPADPTKDQSIFGGWYLGETEYDFATPVTEDISLTAKWIDDVNSNKVPDAVETIQVTIVGNGAVNGKTESFTAVYDSVKEEKYALNIVPAMENGVSKFYVSSVKICDVEQTLTYNADYSVALAADKEKNEVLVTFADAGFTYDEDGEMRFYVGMEDPKYEALYNAVITAPEYNETAVKSVKYLARPAATYQMQVPVIFEYTVPIINYQIKIGGDVVDVDLDDAWLDVGESFKTLTPEALQAQYDTEIQKIKDKIAAIDLSDISWSNAWDKVQQFSVISEELTTLINTIKNEAQYLGYHQFGASGLVDENGNAQEKLQVIYENEAMRLVDENVYVTLVDDRMATVLTGGNVTVEYDEYTNADLLAAIQLTTEEGAAVDGAIDIAVDMSGKAVGTYTYTVTYAGSWDYKPATATFTLTVIKAPSSTDIVNQTVTYGSAYSAAPVITNKHGQTIDLDAIEFFLGLDVADMDVDGDGVKGLEGRMQLIPTKDLQTILAMVGLEEGAELNISDLINALTNTGLLEQWGVSSEMVEALKGVLDSINGVVETNNLMITVGGTYPTDIGAYLHGAVTMDANYETSFDVGYLIIKPDAQRTYLNWNYTDSNGIFTQQLLTSENLGASAYDDAAFTLRNETATAQVQNLFLGFDENGEVVLELFAQNSDPNAIAQALGNGGYTQLAFVAEFGNEMYYAVPIARAFAIIPGVTKLDIIVDGQPSADLYKTVFDNAPVDVTVSGEIPEGSQVKLHYYGIEANTHTYDSDVAPTHTGAYAVTATLLARDGETGELTTVGLDVATIVIQPTESAITTKELQTVVFDGDYHNVADTMEIAASSNVENLKPDTTVITASIATDGSFSENGWAAAQGTVNVDFPRWMDELIAKYAPSVKDGITLSELEAKLLNKLPTITDKLEELGATNEMVNSTRNLLTNVSSLLDEMPADAVLSFKDDYEVLAVGTYAVAAVVTDSDHVPAAKAGVMVIVPSANQVYLDWEYHDENNIWSRDLLKTVSIGAIAYNDKEFTAINTEASKKITYQFIGLDQETGLKIYDNAADLPNGVYTQIAYIELDVESQIVLSDIIVRTIVIVPNMPELQIVNKNGAAQDKFEFTFDNAPVELYVKQNGQTIENQIRYIGLQTNGVEYDSTVPPVHAGAYAAITVLKTQENVGMDVALVTIAPAKSDISVTGGTVAYNGKKQTATVKAESPNSTVTSPDYTLISGTVDISAGVQNIGLESLHGDVNIDLPKWLDDVLAKTDFNRVDADVASLANAISAYRDDLMNLIPEQVLEQIAMSNETLADIIKKVNSGIDELLKILEKLPDDVHLTFENNKGYSELGSYFYYGIVADSDHIPAADTGLLVIEPAEITSVEVTSLHTYNGQAQTATVVVKAGDVELTEDCYTISGNVAIDADNYTVTVVGMGNYTGTRDASWSIAPKLIKSEDVTLDGYATYNGTAFVQNVIVKDGEKTLEANKDYTVEGNTATQVAKNTLTVKGTGNYTGEVTVAWSSGYPIHFQSGDANGMIEPGATVFVDDAAYVLDKNCVAWTADKDRELAIGYVYEISKNHTTDHAYSDTTKNMYIWDLQWNEETGSYNARRVEALDNLLSFAGGSIWLGSNGVNGIRTYYSTTADTEAVKGAFRNLGYEVVTHGVVVGWADKLNGSEPVPNGNNSAAGHSAGNGTFYDEIYPAADKYITPDLRARFYVELKNIETSESKIIYSGSVERSIGYIAYQNIGRVDAQYQPYVKAILDKAAAAGFTYGG